MFDYALGSFKEKAYYVVCDNYETLTDGTGIVHIAPAFGEDDNKVCRENGIGYVNPVGKDGCYVGGLWEGKFVHDVNEEVVDYLNAAGEKVGLIKVRLYRGLKCIWEEYIC